ncbi:MAG: CBS domain-containing protein, partial [Actinomycetota bacterium]
MTQTPEGKEAGQGTTVDDAMSEHVVTVRATETMDRTAQMMVERGVGSAVVTKDGGIEGIITERDVLRAVARGLVPWSTSVSDCMTSKPVTVSTSTTTKKALSMMLDNNYRHLP